MNSEYSPSIRVMFIEDHEIFRLGLKHIIELQANMVVVGMASNRLEALEIVAQEKPDIILLDLTLENENGMDMIADLLMVSHKSRLIVLTASYEKEVFLEAVHRGVRGVVHKSKSFSELINAITSVHRGEYWLDQKTTTLLLDDVAHATSKSSLDSHEGRIASLTPREREIIKLLGEGLKNKEIADRLFISSVTVHHHLTSVYSKLSVQDRVELVIFAFQHGLAELPTKQKP